MKIIDLSMPIDHGHGRLGLDVGFDFPYTYQTSGWPVAPG